MITKNTFLCKEILQRRYDDMTVKLVVQLQVIAVALGII